MSEHVIEAKGLTKRFGGLTAVNSLDLFAEKNEIVSIIGPNGSGKTTCFALLSGFLEPNEGSVHFNGQNTLGILPFKLNEMGLARTFQIVQPFKGITVFDNVMVGAISKGRSQKEAVEITDEILEFSGLARLRNTMASDLTIAESKRLEVARCLATRPTLLLLDEVMAGLRPTEVDEAIEFIFKIREQGMTILFVEHLMRAVVALSDRAYAIHHGTLLASGNPNDVLNNDEVVDAYFGKKHTA